MEPTDAKDLIDEAIERAEEHHDAVAAVERAVGISAGSLILLSALLLLRDPPPAGGCPATAGKDQPSDADFSLREALGHGTFWRIAAIFMFLTGALAALTVNHPVVLRSQGLPP